MKKDGLGAHFPAELPEPVQEFTTLGCFQLGRLRIMKIGVSLLNFGPEANPTALLRWVRGAEALGYHFVMMSDHVAITPDVQARYPVPYYDPFVTLAWLAGVTKKVELGTTVTILPYRHPLQMAHMAVNIDQLSGGRFIFGVGVGWAQQEFEALGVPFDRRGAMANEYLTVIKKYWTEDVVSYEGSWVSFRDVRTGPRPVRSPHPPIWVGGASENALRRAVRFGNAWHPIRFRMKWLKEEGLPNLRRIADAEGLPMPPVCPRIILRLTESPLPEYDRIVGQGTLDQFRSDIETLAALGAEYVLLDTYGGQPETAPHPAKQWEMLELVAARVLDLKTRQDRKPRA